MTREVVTDDVYSERHLVLGSSTWCCWQFVIDRAGSTEAHITEGRKLIHQAWLFSVRSVNYVAWHKLGSGKLVF